MSLNLSMRNELTLKHRPKVKLVSHFIACDDYRAFGISVEFNAVVTTASPLTRQKSGSNKNNKRR